MASWRESKILSGGVQRTLPPGTVIFGMSELAALWKVSKRTIWKWSHYLHDTGRIVLEGSPVGTIATICNWETYQAFEQPGETPGKHEVNTGETPGKPYEEGKKGRKNTARTGVRAEYSAEFEAAWEAYGKEGKKSDAYKAFQESNLSQEEFEALKRAIPAYLADCKAKDRRRMYFGTFLREDWRVWNDRRVASAPKLVPKSLEEL